MPRPLPATPSAREAARLLHRRALADHRANLAELRAATAEFRALLPEARRRRHQEARATARPEARPRRVERPRCGARCRDGHPCTALAVWPQGAPEPRRRCRLHGGLSTGPRTREGLLRALAAIGQVPRHPEAAATSSGPIVVPVVPGCRGCAAAARRCRGAAAWAARHRHEGPVVLGQVIRWTRCPGHARVAHALVARAGGAGVRVEVQVPCA